MMINLAEMTIDVTKCSVCLCFTAVSGDVAGHFGPQERPGHGADALCVWWAASGSASVAAADAR